MDNFKDDNYFIQRIMNDLVFINIHMNNISKKLFDNDELLQDSMMFRLIQISENSQRLSNEFKLHHSSVPWVAVYGLRNRIVHDYGNVDFGIVYDTLINDVPELLVLLQTEET